MITCPNCGTENPDHAKFCLECASPLARVEPRTAGTRKLVTIMFADVVGSTALGEQLDPEALRGLLARYFTQARTMVERHGGVVEKFIGDAVMAVFGSPGSTRTTPFARCGPRSNCATRSHTSTTSSPRNGECASTSGSA